MTVNCNRKLLVDYWTIVYCPACDCIYNAQCCTNDYLVYTCIQLIITVQYEYLAVLCCCIACIVRTAISGNWYILYLVLYMIRGNIYTRAAPITVPACCSPVYCFFMGLAGRTTDGRVSGTKSLLLIRTRYSIVLHFDMIPVMYQVQL